MHILCPHCRNPIEVVKITAREEIACPSCGSSFHLASNSTTGSQSEAGSTLGRFELIETVGHGAFGTVYKARDPELDRTVAIKVPRAGNLAGPSELDRFLREARSVAQLRHPSIVSIHEVGQSDGLPYLVSEFVQGITLADLLSARTPTFREAAEMVAAIADALQYAHDQGVIHRDVKPSNIMLETAESQVRLMDFGLAKRDAGEITMTVEGQVLGTPAYMPPEQARGEGHAVDARGDVYSVGVILYRLLTGELPFRGTQRMLLHQVLHDEPRPPRKVNDRIPRDLETICLKAMAKEPHRRYATARGLADDLRCYLKGEPILARPVGRVERAAMWTRRNPKEAAAYGLAALTLVLVVVGGGFAVLWRDANAARQRAEGAEQIAIKARVDLAEEKKRGDDAAAGKLDAEARAREAEKKTKEAVQEQIARFQYLESIRLAQQLIEGGSGDQARQILIETDPARRGWEWPFLVQQIPTALKGHTNVVSSVAFSPDGRRLASSSWDRTVRVWDLADGGEPRVLKGHTNIVSSVVFSSDGCRLASGSIDQTVRVWDLVTGDEPVVLKGHTGFVSSVVFSPDGRRLATGSKDQTVRVWDLAARGEPLVLKGHIGGVSSVAYSPDGRWLASGSDDLAVRVWDLAAGGASLVLQGHQDRVSSVSFSPDGRQLASGSVDRTVRVWDLTTRGEPLVLKGHINVVWGVAFSPDGRRLASASDDRTVRVWDLATRGAPLVLKGNQSQIRCIAFSPDGRRLASGFWDRTVLVWDLATRGAFLELQGHTAPVKSVAFSPDSRWLASGADRTMRVWDLAAGGEPLVLKNHQYAVLSVAFSPDGRRLASGSGDQKVRIWDLSADAEPLVLKGQTSYVESVAFSPDGRRLAAGIYDRTVRVWDLAADAEPLVLSGHAGAVRVVSFSPDGRHLASGCDDPIVRLWDLASGGEPLVLKGHTRGISSLSFSRDGRRLATASGDQTVRVWDLADHGEPLVLKGHIGAVSSVSFSPDGGRLATGSVDQTVRVWDLAAGGAPLVLTGHQNTVLSVVFSADGRRIASGSEDSSLRVWELNGQSFWRLRTVTDDERSHQWYSARFHLGCLLQEESARQRWEAVAGPIGSAVVLVALQNREGRVPIPEIHRRHCRACLELGDWRGADADFAKLRQLSPNDPEAAKLQALAKKKKAEQRALMQCVGCLQPLPTPGSVAVGIGPRSGYFGE